MIVATVMRVVVFSDNDLKCAFFSNKIRYIVNNIIRACTREQFDRKLRAEEKNTQCSVQPIYNTM